MDRLEKELENSAQVVRVDTLHPAGAVIADEYRVRAVPTLIIFNGQGKVVYSEVGIPDSKVISEIVAQLASKKTPYRKL